MGEITDKSAEYEKLLNVVAHPDFEGAIKEIDVSREGDAWTAVRLEEFNRLAVKQCSTCRYRVEMECRRHSPVTEASRGGHRLWPYTDDCDWCGDWEYKG